MESKSVVPGQYITPTKNLFQDKQQQKNVPVKYVAGSGTVINSIEVDDGKSLSIICATILGKTQFVKVNNTPEASDVPSEDKDNQELSYIVNVIPRDQRVNTDNDNANETADSSGETRNVSSLSSPINLPQENDIVLVRITRISQKQANCEIIALESKSKNAQTIGGGIASGSGSGNILSDSGTGSNGATAQASLPHGGGSQHNHNIQTVASSTTTPSQATIYDLGENYRGIIRASDIRSTERDKIVVGQCFKPGDVVRCMIISLGDGQNYYCSTARNDLGVVLAKLCGGAGRLMYPVDWQHMIDLDSGVVELRKNANPFVV